MRRTTLGTLLVIVAGSGDLACQGEISPLGDRTAVDSPSGTSGTNGTSGASGTNDMGSGAGPDGIIGTPDNPINPGRESEPLVCEGIQAPRHRLTHLTSAQYEHTVTDLLGKETSLTRSFPDDQRVAGFAAPSQVDTTLARQWWTAADGAAGLLEGELASQLEKFAHCAIADGEACIAEFVSSFGERAFRRPLSDVEQQDYVSLYSETVADGNDESTALRAVAQAMFISPNFLFRVEEPPTPETPRALNDYELATRLSYFLWGTMPDDELMEVASAGDLTDPDKLTDQVDRLLSHENARRTAREFVDQWLQLGELEQVSFAPELLTDGSSAFDWDDESAYFSPEAGDKVPPLQGITEVGWYVWDIPATRVTQTYAGLELEVEVETADDGIELGVNLNDTPLLRGIKLDTGVHTITAEVDIPTGSPAKVGIRFRNPGAGRVLTFRELRLTAGVPIDDVRESLREQAIRYFEGLMFEDSGSFQELMTSNVYPTNSTLAAMLGMESPGKDFAPASMPRGERVGVVTLPGVLAAHGSTHSGGTSPIRRGVWLMDRVLCLPHPAPLPQLPDYCSLACDGGECSEGFSCEAGVCIANGAATCTADDECGKLKVCHSSGKCVPDPDFCIPNRTSDQTTRQWWDSFGSTCHGCHTTINGLGYALEHYDGLGRYRETERTSEGDEPVDASGQLILRGEDPIEFYGASGLVDEMLELGVGPNCYTESWFVFAFGQIANGHNGSLCTQQAIHEAFKNSNYNLLEVMRSVALSDGFRHATHSESVDP